MTTVDSDDAADAIASRLVELRLAACVQVLAATSHYRWNGKLERGAERLLLVKTTVARADQVQEWLAERHPYDLPEILIVPVTGGSAGYLGWLADEIG